MTEDIVLSAEVNQNIPSPEKGVVFKRIVEGVEVRLIKDGVPLGANSVVAIPWAAVAIKDGKYIYALSVEREDLRMISLFSGIAVKTLSSEYDVKGYLLEASLMMYMNGEAENLGVFNIEQGEESIKAFLYDSLLESLDIIDEQD